MGGLGQDSCKIILDVLFGYPGQWQGIYVASDLWVVLCSQAPSPADDITSIASKEVAYESYERSQIDNRLDYGWESATLDTPSVKANKQIVEFPPCTGGSSVARYFALFAMGGEKIEAWGALDAELVITDGVVPTFGAGDLRITLE
jgi:hypothetical protein